MGVVIIMWGLQIRLWSLMEGDPGRHMFVSPHMKNNSEQIIPWRGAQDWNKKISDFLVCVSLGFGCVWTSGGLLGAWFGLKNITLDHRCYFTKDQPRRLHQTSICEVFPMLNFGARILILIFDVSVSRSEQKHWPPTGLIIVSWGVRQCIGQHFETLVSCGAQYPGRPFLLSVRGQLVQHIHVQTKNVVHSVAILAHVRPQILRGICVGKTRIVKTCSDCGDEFITDALWKQRCLNCFEKYQDSGHEDLEFDTYPGHRPHSAEKQRQAQVGVYPRWVPKLGTQRGYTPTMAWRRIAALGGPVLGVGVEIEVPRSGCFPLAKILGRDRLENGEACWTHVRGGGR